METRGRETNMKKEFACLERIDHNLQITDKTHFRFLYHLQLALLLALHEQGTLNKMQYRYAQEQLQQQYRNSQKNHPDD